MTKLSEKVLALPKENKVNMIKALSNYCNGFWGHTSVKTEKEGIERSKKLLQPYDSPTRHEILVNAHNPEKISMKLVADSFGIKTNATDEKDHKFIINEALTAKKLNDDYGLHAELLKKDRNEDEQKKSLEITGQPCCDYQFSEEHIKYADKKTSRPTISSLNQVQEIHTNKNSPFPVDYPKLRLKMMDWVLRQEANLKKLPLNKTDSRFLSDKYLDICEELDTNKDDPITAVKKVQKIDLEIRKRMFELTGQIQKRTILTTHETHETQSVTKPKIKIEDECLDSMHNQQFWSYTQENLVDNPEKFKKNVDETIDVWKPANYTKHSTNNNNIDDL